MAEEGDIVGGSGVTVQVLQTNGGRTDIDAEIFEFADEVEEVVRREA